MEKFTNDILLGIGLILIIFAVISIIIRIQKTKKGLIIYGTILSQRLLDGEHRQTVIEYEINNVVNKYVSSHYSIFYKKGKKIRLLYDDKADYVIGTYGELFFIPLMLLFTGLFIAFIIIIYKLTMN